MSRLTKMSECPKCSVYSLCIQIHQFIKRKDGVSGLSCIAIRHSFRLLFLLALEPFIVGMDNFYELAGADQLWIKILG
jgi:hypothetical protein